MEGEHHLSRRNFLKAAAGAGIAGLTLRNPEFGRDSIYDKIGHYRTESFGHNFYQYTAPFTGREFLVDNVEIDTVEADDGEFDVAHSIEEARQLTAEQREYMNLPNFLKACRLKRIPPHIDLKNVKTPRRLIKLLSESQSSFPRITVSSTNHLLLNQILSTGFADESSNGRILYSFGHNQDRQLRSFIKAQNPRIEKKVGASMHISLINEQTIERMHDKGLFALTWKVNTPESFLASLQHKVDGITSDELELFSHMKQR